MIDFCTSSDDSLERLAEYSVTAEGEDYETSYERGFPQLDLVFVPPEIPFEVDEDLLSDPPEGEIDLFTAQRLLAARVAIYEDMEMLEQYDLSYHYRGIEIWEDKEFYRIDLCAEGEADSVFEILRAYRIGGDGTTLWLMDEESDHWLPIAADAMASAAGWWGEYHTDSAILGVSNYSGESFLFSLEEDGGGKLDGAAGVDPQNPYSAEYMDLVFSLSDDAGTIVVTQTGDREDKAQRAAFVGEYHRA